MDITRVDRNVRILLHRKRRSSTKRTDRTVCGGAHFLFLRMLSDPDYEGQGGGSSLNGFTDPAEAERGETLFGDVDGFVPGACETGVLLDSASKHSRLGWN